MFDLRNSSITQTKGILNAVEVYDGAHYIFDLYNSLGLWHLYKAFIYVTISWKVQLNFVNMPCLYIFHQEDKTKKSIGEKERRWYQGNYSKYISGRTSDITNSVGLPQF